VKVYSESKDAVRMRERRKAEKENMSDEVRKEKLAIEAEKKRLARALKKSLEPEKKTKAVVVNVKNDKCSKEKSEAIGEFAKVLDLFETIKQEIPKPVVEKVKEKIVKVNMKVESGANDAEIIKQVRESALKMKKEKAPTEETIKRYLVSIRQIQEELTGEKSSTLDFTNFKDVEGVIDSITNAKTKRGSKTRVSLNTIITRIGALASILKYFEGYEDEAKQYSDIMVAMHEQELQNREKNLPDDNNPIVEWPIIVEKNDHPEIFKDDKERALYAVYTLLPVRRIGDYRTMTVQYENATDLPENRNYLIVDSKGKLIKLVYGQYKTSKHFGEQTQEISEKLAKIITPYVYTRGLGELLFPSSKNREFTEGGFSRFVSDTFEKILGVKTSVNSLRKSSISWFLKQPNISVAQKRKFANNMAHTVQTQGLYNKIENTAKRKRDDEPEPEPEVNVKRKRGAGKLPTLKEIYPWL
jgi:site-specific recombinase XerD